MTRIGLRRKQGREENDKRYAWHQTMPNEGVGDLINDKSSTLQANDRRLRWAEFGPFCVFVQEIGRHLQSIKKKKEEKETDITYVPRLDAERMQVSTYGRRLPPKMNMHVSQNQVLATIHISPRCIVAWRVPMHFGGG